MSPGSTSAPVTEHFVLQSAASSTISESDSRVAIYLSSLSSGLVAIGFASSSPHALAALTFSVLPTVFILGCFTVVRRSRSRPPCRRRRRSGSSRDWCCWFQV
jgi:hypothetical protein